MIAIKIPKNLNEILFMGLIAGLIIGILGWVFSSPILGGIIGYNNGALIGMVFASLLVAYFYHEVANESNILTILFIIIFLPIFVYYGGLTNGVKEIIDQRISQSEFNWTLAWISIYGVITMLVGGIVWLQKNIKKT